MTKDQSQSTARSSRSTRTPRPQINTEFEFKTSEGGGVDPRLTIDGPADDRTADTGTSGDLADTVLVGEGPQFEGEESSDFGHGIGTDLVGPVAAETTRRGSDGTGHKFSLRAREVKTLHSTNADVTGQAYGVLSKQQQQQQVRLGATVTRKIENFVPMIPSEHWDAIGAFVRSAITDVEPSSPIMAKKALGSVTAFVHWAWKVGYELDRKIVFDRFTIEEFIAVGYPQNWSNGTRRNMRTQLFSVSQVLLGAEARIPRLNPLPGETPSQPYSAKEIIALRSWANGQATPTRRRDAIVLLALGAGAGLKVEDLFPLRRRDITVIDGFVIVNVGGRRPRQVPVLAEWEGDLLDAISVLSPDVYAFSQGRTGSEKNTVTHFVDRTSGEFKPHTFRLRVTWLVHHLTVGTPVKPFLAAAGVYSSDMLTRYLQFVPDVEAAEARRLLRGG
jgi:integrase